MISKVLCIRMKAILRDLISETQSAFVSGRLISDNIIIAQEMFHGLRTNQAIRDKFLAIKTDMSKAYDRMEWSFLKCILLQLGFHPHWVDCVMWCVTSVSFQVLINGQPKGHIVPSKGLRQGDPLSPYLFILCTEALTANLRKMETNGLITGMKIARSSPAISHLFFADDSLFFCKATQAECLKILGLLGDYERASGQMINFNKSSVLFGDKVPVSLQHDLKHLLGIHKEGGMGNYLGIPESLGGSKAKIFNYVKETLNGKVNGWSSKLLSKGGKEVMLKSVAFALPNHVMSCFRLPQTLITKLNSAVSNFWWGSSGTSRGIHWNAWDNLCFTKEEGGLGFRSLYDFNTALLAKQLWRLDKFPDSLVAKVLKGRHYPNSHPFYACKARAPSYGWSSLVSARDLIISGTRWRVGSGEEILVWEDSWLPDSLPRPAKGGGQIVYPDLRVNELMSQGGIGWNIPLLHQLLDPEDIPLVQCLTLRPSIQEDKALWHLTKTGDYTVKSGYELARSRKKGVNQLVVTEPSFTALKANVWKIDCPSKIKHFMWQVLNGSLAVLSRLRQRGVNINAMCKGCGLEEETINHVLFECEVAKSSWTILCISNNNTSFPSLSVYDNMDFLFWRFFSWRNSGGELMDNKDIFPWVLWYLWKSRNKKIFQGAGWSTMEIIQLAEREWLLWKEAKISVDIETPLGVAPSETLPPNFCKVDGSWKKGDTTSGFGWICYADNHPMLLGGRGVRRSLSPLHTEFEALIWAMQVILERGLPCSLFLTDCLELVKIIREPNLWPAFDVYLESFADMRRSFPNFSLAHTRREFNSQADNLARGARERLFEFTYVNRHPPPWVSNFYSFF